jgi:gamma-glutamyl-gamma-aminobutyrate hydrolase PuuD
MTEVDHVDTDMPKPIIGITTGRRNEAAAAGVRASPVAGIPLAYPQAVQRSGGAPVLLPRCDDPEVIAAVVARIDALMLTGGGDVVSLRYGAEPHPKSGGQDPVRDAAEILAAHAALARGLPILGICRGIQLLNVALGGTLIQDIPQQVGGAWLHSAQPVEATLIHTVDIEPDSLLARVLGVTSTPVNSSHHQAVDRLAVGLRVTARARDGVIEAVESTDPRPILAVQWHPETISQEYPLFQRLFDWLVTAAAAGGCSGS